MAQIPTQEEVDEIIKHNAVEHAEKAAAQKAEGKSFNQPADGHGSGVIPEEVWQTLPGKTEQNNG